MINQFLKFIIVYLLLLPNRVLASDTAYFRLDNGVTFEYINSLEMREEYSRIIVNFTPVYEEGVCTRKLITIFIKDGIYEDFLSEEAIHLSSLKENHCSSEEAFYPIEGKYDGKVTIKSFNQLNVTIDNICSGKGIDKYKHIDLEAFCYSELQSISVKTKYTKNHIVFVFSNSLERKSFGVYYYTDGQVEIYSAME
ncbi:hypothetical protein [uncultured Shewanella sp.]|uniref:hypothetical protein n=1 Tax=uncultured Shewanella sp. TaxID=173975 RepID=UPI00262B85BD|nr:hypothetical protein [uncultured Shewanella sp.]